MGIQMSSSCATDFSRLLIRGASANSPPPRRLRTSIRWSSLRRIAHITKRKMQKKLFEEPPPRTYLFLVLPSLGGLLQTLRSRVQVLSPYQDVVRSTSDVGRTTSHTSNIPKATAEFLKA